MQVQPSSFQPKTHETKKPTRERNPIAIDKPTKVVSWRANIGGPSVGLQPVDRHGNTWAQSPKPRLPWLRPGTANPNETLLVSKTPSENYTTPLSSPHQGRNPVVEEDRRHLTDASGKIRNPPCVMAQDQVIQIDSPQTKVASTANDIKAPRAQRPRSAVKLLQQDRANPAEALTNSIRQYEILMRQMVAVTNEAANFMIANQAFDQNMFSPPSSLDGAVHDNDTFFEVPIASDQDLRHHQPYLQSPDRGSASQSNHLSLHAQDIPIRQSSRNAMESAPVSPLTKQSQKHGLADAYYHPSAKPVPPPVVQDIDAKQHLQRFVCEHVHIALLITPC